MKRRLAILLLLLGFWMLGIIACPRQTQLTKNHRATSISAGIMGALVAAGLYLLTAKETHGKRGE